MRKLSALIVVVVVVCLSGCAGVRQHWGDMFFGAPKRIKTAWKNNPQEPLPPGEFARDVVTEIYQSNNDLNDAEDRNEEFFGSAYPQ